jgi:hypothetical protein
VTSEMPARSPGTVAMAVALIRETSHNNGSSVCCLAVQGHDEQRDHDDEDLRADEANVLRHEHEG